MIQHMLRFIAPMTLKSHSASLIRQIYIARIFAYILVYSCVLSATAFHIRSYTPVIVLIGLVAVFVPHYVYRLHSRYGSHSFRDHFEKIEFRAVYFDNLYCGFSIALCYYYPPAFFALALISYANLITVGGRRLWRNGAIALPVGILLGMLSIGFHTNMEGNVILMALSGILIATYLFSIVIINYSNHIKLSDARKQVTSALGELRKETKRSEELLLNILPHEIAKELRIYGKSMARSHEFVSVLFTDFTDFTRIAESYPAEWIVNELDQCYHRFDEICEHYGIEKIKTIGDSYMAASGLHSKGERECTNIVSAALEMLEFIAYRNSFPDTSTIPLTMRAGIHSGSLVSGIVGYKKFQYDLWGDTVNTASRIETNGVPGKLNISHSTYELLKEDQAFVCTCRGAVAAKGKGNIMMYLVAKNDD